MFPARSLSRTAAPLLFLVPVGCADNQGPGSGPHFSIEFEVPAGGVEPPTVDATVIERGVQIAGRFLLPVPCYTVTDTSFTAADRDLTLAISVTQNQGACFDIVVNMLFDASITELPPDRYALEVQLYRDGALHMRYGKTLAVPGGS